MAASLACAMARGVDVMLVITNASSILDGDGNGWLSEEVAAAMELWILENPGIISDDIDVHDLICERFNIAGLRFSEESTWPDGSKIGNHSKFMIADEHTFYLGSQNLYPADLVELGLIVDDAELTAEVMAAYWEPMWAHSVQGAISGSQAPSCSF